MKKLIFLAIAAISLSLNAQVYDVNSDIILNDLELGTQKVVNATFTVTKDSAFVFLCVENADNSTNQIQYKGNYGSWLLLPTGQAKTFGTGSHVLGTMYIRSTATTDTVYVTTYRKR